MSLDTISVQRAGLPTFPGLTLRDQLLAGAKQAGDILRKYAQGYRFDPEAADRMLALVNAWQLRNDAELQAALADPSVTRVPDQVKLTFGSDIAQGWIVAGYVQAARTLGLERFPLGPPAHGWVPGRVFYDAVLSGRPYRVRALVRRGQGRWVRRGLLAAWWLVCALGAAAQLLGPLNLRGLQPQAPLPAHYQESGMCPGPW